VRVGLKQVASTPQSVARARSELSRRLEERRGEIEATVMTRVYSVADPTDLDPSYAEGLRTAVRAAVDYGLCAVELGDERSPPPPPLLLAQARIAARNEVSLDTVLRRYFAGHSLLIDFLVEEAGKSGLLAGMELQGLLRSSATLFDRLLEAVAEEHARESEGRPTSSAERRRECVKRLLAGELVDTAELGYDLEGHHLGLMAKGEEAREAMGELARQLGRRLLAVLHDEEVIWACWLGGRRALDSEQALAALAELCPDGVLLALGEPGRGLWGWRLSHRQAKAALAVAERRGEAVVRYRDVALLAAVLQDDLLATSLREMYLKPLERGRNGGKALRETLRAYFATERNISSTAVAMGVNRNTVASRLRTAEASIGRISDCAIELDIALRLDELAARNEN
jgi:GGDEF-like domain/PucR C-terminal helix-turn-helix domain